jgi:ABC-type uncharacterized transport system permease subunit
MEGIERVVNTGVRYTQSKYVPRGESLMSKVLSVAYIVVYTAVVWLLTEYLMRGKVTRWLYMGTVAMTVAFVYSGVVDERHLGA